MNPDKKLKDILYDNGATYQDLTPVVEDIKAVFAESGEYIKVNASQETQAAIANTMLGNKVMTGQEWYDRFNADIELAIAELPDKLEFLQEHLRPQDVKEAMLAWYAERVSIAAKKAAGLEK